MAARGTLPPELRAASRGARRAADAAMRQREPRAGDRGEGVDGSHPPRHLRVLRLADLHQVQVAAVEHHHAGHRRGHPDRRPDGDDPDAQRRRAVDREAAHLQVHGADRLAGARSRARGRGRGGQSPRQEGRRAVQDRSDPLPARCQQPDRAACDRAGVAARAGRIAEGSVREDRRDARGDPVGERAHRRGEREARARAETRRPEPRARALRRGQPVRPRAGGDEPRGGGNASSRPRRASLRRRARPSRRRSRPRRGSGRSSAPSSTDSSRRSRRSARSSRTRSGSSTRRRRARPATATSSTCSCAPAASSRGCRSTR